MRKSKRRPKSVPPVPAGCMDGIVEFRAPDDNAALSSLVQLLENLAGTRNAFFPAFDAKPALARGNSNVKGRFQLPKKLIVAAVECLHGAGILELQSKRFQIIGSHRRAPNSSAPEAIFPP